MKTTHVAQSLSRLSHYSSEPVECYSCGVSVTGYGCLARSFGAKSSFLIACPGEMTADGRMTLRPTTGNSFTKKSRSCTECLRLLFTCQKCGLRWNLSSLPVTSNLRKSPVGPCCLDEGLRYCALCMSSLPFDHLRSVRFDTRPLHTSPPPRRKINFTEALARRLQFSKPQEETESLMGNNNIWDDDDDATETAGVELNTRNVYGPSQWGLVCDACRRNPRICQTCDAMFMDNLSLGECPVH